MTIIVTMTVATLADAKAHFSSYVDTVARTHDRVVVTRHGVPVSVLISVDELESLEETLAILSDGALLDEIRSAGRELGQGAGEVWDSYEQMMAA